MRWTREVMRSAPVSFPCRLDPSFPFYSIFTSYTIGPITYRVSSTKYIGISSKKYIDTSRTQYIVSSRTQYIVSSRTQYNYVPTLVYLLMVN